MSTDAERQETPTVVLAAIAGGLTIERIEIAQLREQDLNAHVMPPQIFARLVENIRKRGALESLPYCAVVAGKVEIVSGHHRIRAGRTAGLTTVDCLVDRSGLKRSTIIAKQLAHNALVGRDDMAVVRDLVQLIDSPDDLIESGLDENVLASMELEHMPAFPVSTDFQWKAIAFQFLPHQLAEFEDLIKSLQGRKDLIGAVPEEQYESFLLATGKYAKAADVRNIGTAIALLTRVAQRELALLEAAEAEGTELEESIVTAVAS